MAVKLFRKGEVIFEEGDALDKFFVVQSGSVQVGLRKEKAFVDFFAVGPNGFLGEYGLLGHNQHLFTAVARTETQVLEIPKQALKDEINQVPGFVKILIKSSLERLKTSTQTLRHFKSPDQLSLFPSESLPLLFAGMFYAAKEKAVESKVPGTNPPRMQWTLDFRVLKSQMQRVFNLPVAQVANFCHLLWRLDVLQTEEKIGHVKDWNPVEQVTIHHLDSLRFFFDFYQYYFFKNGREDVLKIDPTLVHILEEMTLMYSESKIVSLGELEKRVLKKKKIILNAEHFARFEKKGVFVQRVQKTSEAFVEGDWTELTNILWAWRFLHSFDTANAHGTVEFEVEEMVTEDDNQCPSCKKEVQVQQKFCAECGCALAKAG